METIIIRGYNFQKEEQIIITLLEVAKKLGGGVLSDDLFTSVLQEYEMEDKEEEVISQMLEYKIPRFVRHSDGWDVFSEEDINDEEE